jgi:hypothetical protein
MTLYDIEKAMNQAPKIGIIELVLYGTMFITAINIFIQFS